MKILKQHLAISGTVKHVEISNMNSFLIRLLSSSEVPEIVKPTDCCESMS